MTEYRQSATKKRHLVSSVAFSCILLYVVLWTPARITPVLRTKAEMVLGSTHELGAASASGGAGSDGWTSGGPARGSACRLNLDDSPLASSCHRLSNVCVDQQTAILYDEKYHPAQGRPAAALPVLDPPKRHRHYIFYHRGSGEKDYGYGLPPLHVRPASADEASRYLSHPVFSSCTVPVVYYSHYIQNVAHMFRDNAARLYGALLETPWAAHAKLVLMTAEGLAPPPFAADLLQPLSPLRMETWADFTNRLPSRRDPGGKGYLPEAVYGGDAELDDLLMRDSYEGGPRRCFRHMLVCMDNLNISGWPLHAYGQHLVRHYERQGLMPRGKLPADRPAEATQRRLVAAAGAGGSSGGSGSGRVLGEAAPVVNIVFQRRSAPERQLLNSAELLERCNSWRYTTSYGVEVAAKCWEVELPDLLTGIAAAQQADIFVGAHGANIANAWLMRPGSSILELTMFEFDDTDAHMNLVKRNMFDNDTEVQFWKVLLCDPASWTPGLLEKKGLESGEPFQDYWPKYRNMIVRWEVLETAFQEIVETGGDMAAFRRRYQEGRWWWLSGGNQMVYAGRNIYQTCKKARAEGLID